MNVKEMRNGFGNRQAEGNQKRKLKKCLGRKAKEKSKMKLRVTYKWEFKNSELNKQNMGNPGV